MNATEFLDWLWRVFVWLMLQGVAPFVVPIALVFTPSDTGRLPRVLRWWETPDDFDVWHAGLYEPQVAAIGDRFVRAWYWLGIRNRALGWQYAAGFPWHQEIAKTPGFKRVGPAWRFDWYGPIYFGCGWKTHGTSDDPATWLAVPFLTVRFKP